MAFAQDVAQRRGLDAEVVRDILAQARSLPRVQQLMRPAPTEAAKNWGAYRARFIEPVRLKAGLAFWQANRRWLDKAEAATGVPASLIVGVLGVETLYGRHMGGFRVIDALATLAFDFPPEHPRARARSAYFLGELEQFLSLTQRTGQDPLTVRGSYAGAMGLPQFMPSSWVNYAVDFDGDGRIDLFRSPADAIGSVANYFQAFGWKPGMPTHYAVQLVSSEADMEVLMAPDILPTFSADSIVAKGAQLDDTARTHAGPLALIELHNGLLAQGERRPPSYVVGTENFYTVTRYNWSSYYAMAVIELGQTIEAQLRGQPEPVSLASPRTPP
ncbi:MAG: lytic murein transglycosylase B [Burkholderiaceae bacterium]|nr:lytic murein transglycosylase B [Burkholderiaceae bacterium]MDZ4162235.1 lytic murein transglycosylase B [Burkholderiales bacterium]